MEILQLFIAAWIPILKMLIVTAVGSFIALPSIGVLSEEARKNLNSNFHFPNDVVTIVPKRSDRASLPPLGYLTISETNLRAGLRFPPPAELIEILRRCGVNLSQFSFRAMSVTVGLIALFRDRGATLTPEHLSRMGRYGRVTFRSKWLDLRTRDPSKNWANAFFFVKNDWGLLEKWGRMKDLPSPLHVEEEDIMRILKVPDIEHLLFEVRHISRYIEEEFLFKVGLSFHAGSSEPSKVIEDFKKSIAFKIIIQDHVQKARDHIYDIEVKALEQQCIEDGFIRGFLKGVVYYVFLPSLAGNNLSKSFTLTSVASTWFMPINMLLTFVIGSAFGWILNKIIKVPSHLRALLLGCSASGNLGVMLLIIIPATCNEVGGLFGNPALCNSRALSYASICMGINNMIFWSYVYNIVRLSVGFREEKKKIRQNEASAPKSIEDGAVSTNENGEDYWKDAKESFSASGEYVHEKSCTKLSEPSTKSKIIGLTIGIVSPFRRALIGEKAPLRSIQANDNIDIILHSDEAVPATTLIMGGNLVKGFHKSDIKMSAVVGVVIVRYLLLPLTGVCIIKGAIHIGILHPDPLYHFVLLVQYAVPPAMNMGKCCFSHFGAFLLLYFLVSFHDFNNYLKFWRSVISQLLGAGESECSVIFFWTYALTLVLFPLWSAYFIWLVHQIISMLIEEIFLVEKSNFIFSYFDLNFASLESIYIYKKLCLLSLLKYILNIYGILILKLSLIYHKIYVLKSMKIYYDYLIFFILINYKFIFFIKQKREKN
ncbi:hypothetical protein IEQ34_008418 [Dendrobium chrysotoxum]|uniref:PIN-like protein n=1 Tax=Dendrobium chrysotoxum TaxID=161865 RepID=A0AAV7GYV1_DENCH|nr:hypothetical protein IEQ34_008418 [Dendrobium chrysotoxum]